MQSLRDFLGTIPWDRFVYTGLRIVLILLLTWVGLKIITQLLNRIERKLTERGHRDGEPPSEVNKRIDTLMRLVRQAVRLAVWIVVALIVLREIGIDITPLLAGAGIVGLAVGFGAQNLVRDIITGFFFVLENQVRVGDVAIINGTAGIVESINFRTLVLRDLAGIVHIFPNGTVTTLSNMTKEWSAYIFEIGVAYKENTDRVSEVIRQVCQEMREDPRFGLLILEDPEIFGVDKLGDSAVVIKGRIKTKPIRQWEVGREFLRRVKLAFDAQDIEIPFPHQTVYFGEASKPFDVQLRERFVGEPPSAVSAGLESPTSEEQTRGGSDRD